MDKAFTVYELVASRILEKIDSDTNTGSVFLQLGTLKHEFAEYTKTLRTTLATDLYK